MITIPFYTPAITHDATSSRIPKRIYQTWKTREVPSKVADTITELRNNNPTYEYYLFGDKECREYLIKNYDKEYIDAFDDLIPGAFKADFWRYAILAKEGGVYIDLDMKPLKPLDYILGDSDFITIKDRIGHTDKYAIFQAFIATVPNHPFLIETRNYVLGNIQKHYHGGSPLGITGPLAMGRSIKRVLKYCPLKIGDTNSKRLGKYKILLWVDAGGNLFPKNGEPVIATTDCIVDTNNVQVFATGKIDGYEAHQSYSGLFHNKNVYRSYERDIIDKIISNCKNFFVDIGVDIKVRVYNILMVILLSVLLIYIYRNYKKSKSK
jgi:hypothetical protein